MQDSLSLYWPQGFRTIVTGGSLQTSPAIVLLPMRHSVVWRRTDRAPNMDHRNSSLPACMKQVGCSGKDTCGMWLHFADLQEIVLQINQQQNRLHELSL